MKYYTINKYDSLPLITSGDHEIIHSPLYKRKEIKANRNGRVVFQYTISGNGLFFKDNNTYLVKEGEGFLWELGDERISYQYPANSNKPWEFIWLHFHSGLSLEIAREIIDKIGPQFHIYKKDKGILEIINFLNFSKKHKRDQIEATTGAHIFNLFIRSLIDNSDGNSLKQNTRDISSKAIVFIKKNLQSGISVSDVANNLNISREYLTRIFSKQLGVTPSVYIRNEKLQKALNLLISTDLSIKEIAYETGFKNTKLFRTRFKIEFGFTPSQYRQLKCFNTD